MASSLSSMRAVRAAGDYMYRNYENDYYIISSPSYQTHGQGDGDSDTIA